MSDKIKCNCYVTYLKVSDVAILVLKWSLHSIRIRTQQRLRKNTYFTQFRSKINVSLNL